MHTEKDGKETTPKKETQKTLTNTHRKLPIMLSPWRKNNYTYRATVQNTSSIHAQPITGVLVLFPRYTRGATRNNTKLRIQTGKEEEHKKV